MKQQFTLIKGLKLIAFGCMLFMTVTMLHSCGGDKETKTEAAPAVDSTKKDSMAPMKTDTMPKKDTGKGDVPSKPDRPKL